MSRSLEAAVIIIVLVVIAVVVLAIVLATGLVGSNATLKINVRSSHVMYSVDWNVYIDGNLVKTGTVDALASSSFFYTYHWASSGEKTITVSASSTGGGLGPVQASTLLTVSNGGMYAVDLVI